MASYPSLPFRPGDPVPWFEAVATNNPRFNFSAVAGRYVLLCFFGSAGLEPAALALEAVRRNQFLFDDAKVSFFGVSCDPEDERTGRVRQSLPGLRFFWDFDLAVARRYGAAVPGGEGEAGGAGGGTAVAYQPFWLLLDPMLRVMACLPLAGTETVLRLVAGLPDVSVHAGLEVPAPVLVLPRVFEPDFCRALIALYETHGGEESGFMREIDGRTVAVRDAGHKRRSDHDIVDDGMRALARRRIERRVVPEIRKAFQFAVTRMERYIVACYDATDGGHFRPHRDNTTKGTAHRRFAVSINLNAEEFQGGDLRFPEFGPRTYRPPTGGAVVFSCSLLHEVLPVRSGRRYAFLPFLYDEAGARQRVANNPFLGEGVGEYRLGGPGGPGGPGDPAPAESVAGGA